MNDMPHQWWRMGGVMGVLFVAVFVASIVISAIAGGGNPPLYDEPVGEIRAHWEEDGQAYLIGDFVVALAYILLFLPFVVYLRSLLGLAEGGPQVWSRVVLIGGVLSVAISAAATAPWTTLAFAAENLSDDAIVILMHLDRAAWNLAPFPMGLLLLAASYVILTTGVMWRWLGVSGVLIGIAAVIAPISIIEYDPESALSFLGFIAFLGLAIWILAASIGMLMRKAPPVPAAVTPVDAA